MKKPKFSELVFESHPSCAGIQCIRSFNNGYGASIIKTLFSYGGDKGLYELAVLYENAITYDTPITGDVIGHCTEDEVMTLLQRIEALPYQKGP